jgi:hypothetical protein
MQPGMRAAAVLAALAVLGCAHVPAPRQVDCAPGTSPRAEREPDGSRAEWCEAEDGLREGELRRIAASGRTLERGFYERGLESGEWTSFHPNGAPRASVTWQAGEQSGPTQGFFPDGQLAFRGALRAGRQDGVWEEWLRGGQLRYRGEFAAGVPLRESFWHANGELEREGGYRDGQRDGAWQEWSDTGERVAICRWRRGAPAGPCAGRAQTSLPAKREDR